MAESEHIRISEEGLDLRDRKDRKTLWRCRWEQIPEIVARKQDVFIHDLIGIGFRIGEESDYLVAHAEQTGWGDLLAALQKRFEISDDWWPRVAFPPFKENWTVQWGTAFPRPCSVCGYDLRATPDRCRECGTEVKGSDAAT